MKFSILIPAYNAAAYIGQCLDSILAQTVNDYEVVILNDGSKDETDSTCREYVRRDNRIRYTWQDRNKGVAYVRNRLLDMAAGEWIVFVDADDYVVDNYLEEFDKQISRYPETDVFVCNIYYDVYGKRIIANLPFKGGKKDYYHELLRKRYWKASSGLCAKVIRHSLVERHHIRCKEEFNLGEDLYFLVVLLYHTDNIVVDNRARYFYRKVENSITHDSTYTYQDVSCFKAVIDFINSKPDAKEYTQSLNVGKMQIRHRWYLSVKRGQQGDADPFVFNDVRYKALPLLDRIRLFFINQDMFNAIRAINRIARFLGSRL